MGEVLSQDEIEQLLTAIRTTGQPVGNMDKIGNKDKTIFFNQVPDVEVYEIPEGIKIFNLCDDDNENEAKPNTFVKKIIFPKTIEHITYKIFNLFPNLQSVTFAEGNSIYKTKDGITYEDEEIIFAKPNILPNELYVTTKFSRYETILNQPQVKKIIFADDVEHINDNLFENGSIEEIVIGKSINDIFLLSLNNFFNLKKISVSEKNEKYYIKDDSLFEKEIIDGVECVNLLVYFGDSETLKIPHHVSNVIALSKKIKSIEFENANTFVSPYYLDNYSDELKSILENHREKQIEIKSELRKKYYNFIMKEIENQSLKFEDCTQEDLDEWEKQKSYCFLVFDRPLEDTISFKTFIDNKKIILTEDISLNEKITEARANRIIAKIKQGPEKLLEMESQEMSDDLFGFDTDNTEQISTED